MSSETVGLLAASVFLLIAVVGGGFTVRELSVPTVPTWARLMAGALGVLFAVPFVVNLVGVGDGEAAVPVVASRDGERAIPASVEGSAVVHRDSQPDTSPQGVSVVDVVATAPSAEPRVTDRITVTFSLENAGDAPLGLDATFVGARGPEDTWKDFGEGNHQRVLQPGERLTVTSGKVLDAPGIWSFWPCYQIGDELCPDEWKAFEVAVSP